VKDTLGAVVLSHLIMKTCQSLTIALAMTQAAVNGFVCPLNAASRTRCAFTTAASFNEESDVILSTGDWVKGLAFSAIFGLAMVMNPLPSVADGRVTPIAHGTRVCSDSRLSH
jgi:hypothetical protein